MESLFWYLANRTAETQFIYNLFHLLLAGLTLLVLLHQLRESTRNGPQEATPIFPVGFFLLVSHFALLTLRFGGGFFFQKDVTWPGFENLTHMTLGCGLLLVVGAHLGGRISGAIPNRKWINWSCALVALLALADVLLPSPQWPTSEGPHSAVLLAIDCLVLVAIAVGIAGVTSGNRQGRIASLIALGSWGAAFLLHGSLLVLPAVTEIYVWNAEQHLLSIALFAFAWAVGESSHNLFHRVFVRLNLTFIILASLIMLITAGMEKYQYLRLAEERSINLAEFLRGHISYYRAKGESLKDVFGREDVLRRVVIEFGNLPELRVVNVYLDGQLASLRYTAEGEVLEEIGPALSLADGSRVGEWTNSFKMIHLPLHGETGEGQIEFIGTMDYINEYIGTYIILIYSLFTVMVGLGSGVIGMIVTDADRRIRRQYAELQEAQDQLTQATKLASVGELAGGMAHEINNPITSILSLADHMAKEPKATLPVDRQRRNLRLIAQQAERVSKIVRNLLMFARHSRLELNRVDLGEVLETALTLVQYRLKDSSIRLDRQLNGALPTVVADAGRLTEVFVNLLNNAIDAMPNGGTLTVRARPSGDSGENVCAEVVDTGCGIPPDRLPRIFDPFFTTKEPGCGTGLGLSICHGIVRDHGGQIRAQSQPGQGATFVVTLPQGG